MRSRPIRSGVVAALVGWACAQSGAIPPAPAPEGETTFVSANFDLTWSAALDHFATTGVPIASRDRGSGVVESEPAVVSPSEAAEYADCGAIPSDAGAEPEPRPYLATTVVYRVEVSDDGDWSTVLATASWDTGDPDAPFGCETTRVWESEAQEAIKLAAEVNR